MNFKLFTKTWIIYFLLAFPGFYFVYKYGSPDFGLKDFYSYYELYGNWNLDKIEAPFNMRLLSSFFVYLLNKSGLHYDTAINFEQTGLSKQIFFNAVFFNFLCIVTTCVTIFFTIRKFSNNTLLSFAGGVLYLLGFGTLFYEFMPITDAMSILLFAVILYGYLSKKYWILWILLLLILQREYIFMALGLIAVMDFWKLRDKYYLHTLFICIAAFAVYFVLRKTIFYTPKYDHQASPGYFLQMFTELRFPLFPYIKQTFMTLNLFIVYILLIIYKRIKKMGFDRFNFLKLLLLFIQINVISFAAVFGNNTGRYFYILIPIVIYYLTIEAKPLFKLSF